MIKLQYLLLCLMASSVILCPKVSDLHGRSMLRSATAMSLNELRARFPDYVFMSEQGKEINADEVIQENVTAITAAEYPAIQKLSGILDNLVLKSTRDIEEYAEINQINLETLRHDIMSGDADLVVEFGNRTFTHKVFLSQHDKTPTLDTWKMHLIRSCARYDEVACLETQLLGFKGHPVSYIFTEANIPNPAVGESGHHIDQLAFYLEKHQRDMGMVRILMMDQQ